MADAAQERRALTVLFCDAVGFTSLSESRELEDVDRLRSSFLTTCRAAVDRYGGHVHEILGDGVVAYFGYSVAREHDVYRAVLAGLSIVSSLQSEQGKGAETIGARVGIDTGVVLLTRAGEGPETLARRALGTPPNRAARLQALASPNSVVVTRDVQIQISRDFGVVSLGMHRLHNVPAPMEVFQISERSQRFSRFDLLGAAPSPFVDRVEPAEYLLAVWDRAQHHEKVPPVLITGEAGVGKSRLLTEVLTRADAFPSVISLHCSAYADVSPLYPIRVGLEQYAGLGQGLTADAVVGFVTGLGMDPGTNVPLIATVLGREPLPGYPLPELMPNLLRDRLLDCLCEVIVTVASRSPVMLMIEDLQWADETTRALLARLVNDGLPGGLHVVATAREETAWPVNTPPPTALRLSRLATRDTVALVGALAAGLPVDDIGEIAVRSEGLPLFAEQLVFAHGAGAPGRARASKASDVPQLIVQLAQERLDLLGPAKRTAQMAAVIGREFDVALLEASVDRLDRDDATTTPSADVADHLDLLVRSAIVESAPSGSSTLQFRHAQCITAFEK